MTTTKKTTKATKITKTDAPSAALANASINSAPTNVSAPPETWVETDKIGKKGRHPRNGLPLVAPAVADELRKNATALSQELGPKAVDPQQLAGALDDARAWDKAEAQASTFHTYTRSQRNASWDAAITLMAGMKLGVRFAVARDASFADRFPGVAKAFAPTRRSKKTAAPAAGTTATATPAPKTASRKTSATVAPEPAPTPAAAAPAAVAASPEPTPIA